MQGGGVVIVQRDGCADDAQGGIAFEFVYQPAVFVGGAITSARSRLSLSTNSCGDVADFSGRVGPTGESARRDGFGDVPTEQLTHAVAFGETADHVVDGRLENTDLTAVIDGHLDGVVAQGDSFEFGTEVPEWLRDGLSQDGFGEYACEKSDDGEGGRSADAVDRCSAGVDQQDCSGHERPGGGQCAQVRTIRDMTDA